MNHLISKLNQFEKTPILVIGDLMVDRYIRGDVARISPEAPVPVVDVRREEDMPGGAGNVASNIAALGGRPILISVVGHDGEADRLLKDLESRGVNTSGIVGDDTRPTIVKTRIIAGHQQVVRFDRENRSALTGHFFNKMAEEIKLCLPKVKGILLSDYGKGIVSSRLLRFLLPLARRHKKFVTVDPKVEHFLQYKGVHCLTPNLKEATEGMRVLPPQTDEEVNALGSKILQRMKSDSVLVTRGERGMSLFQKGKKPFHIPSVAREVYDVTGAGDTVISVFSLALAAGCSYPDAARIANVAAGVVVAKLGTATLTRREIKKALKETVL